MMPKAALDHWWRGVSLFYLTGVLLLVPPLSPSLRSAPHTGQRTFPTKSSAIAEISTCRWGIGKPTAQETIMRFFYIVNKTGVKIKLKVFADGKELLVTEVEGKPEQSLGIVHPQGTPDSKAGEYPTVELKIPMGSQVKRLSIRETLHIKKRAAFVLSELPEKQDAGFRIIISEDGVEVTQDYYPQR